jgi:cytochrome c biogenesis protein ResB
VAHVSAFVLVAAIAARPALLWLEPSVDLLPGQVYTVERTEPFTVRAGELTIERHPDGQPRNYLAPLALVQSGRPAVTQTVRFGRPMTHRQVNFHLQGYGPGLRLETPEGIFHLALDVSQAQELSLPQTDLRFRIARRQGGDELFVEILTANGTILGSGSVADGQKIEVRGLPILFNLSPYTTWQVSSDPTLFPAIGAAIILLSGTVISLWVPHRRLWLRIDAYSAQMVGMGDFGSGPGSSFEAPAPETAIQSSTDAETPRVAAGSALSGQDEVSDA